MSDKTKNSKFPLTIEQASAAGLCRFCNYAGRGKYEYKPCDYHRLPSLNWLKVPEVWMCALTEEDIARKREDMAAGRK